MTLLEKVNQFPPNICRLLAAPKTTRDIAEICGLPKSTVHQVSLRPNWNGVTVEVMEKFSHGCGVNLLATKREKQFMHRRSWRFLKSMTANQRRMINRLLTATAAR